MLWTTTHPGPVTALALRGDRYLIFATTCSCFNGSGYSIRIADQANGRCLRRIGNNSEWAPRKTISFLLPTAQQQQQQQQQLASGGGGASFDDPGLLFTGFGAPLSSVAVGAVAAEKEVGRVFSLCSVPSSSSASCSMKSKKARQQEIMLRERQRQRTQRQRRNAHSGGGGDRWDDGDVEEMEDTAYGMGGCPVEAPAWGLECCAAHGGVVAAGADNGVVAVFSASGTHRHRVLDACALAGLRSSSAKVSSVCVAGTKLFVALQASAGDKETTGLRGRLLELDLLPDGETVPSCDDMTIDDDE